MNTKYHKQKAQSTLEYVMVIACLTAALLGMQIYIKRGIQGRLRDAADQIGEQYSAETTKSKLTQIISGPDENAVTTTTIGTPKFIQHPDTGEQYEVVEITRTENTVVTIGEGSYEETGKLSDEELFKPEN